jgi:hypothetical protein
MWQMTGSKATSGESRCGKWQLQAVIQNARANEEKESSVSSVAEN